MAQIIFEFKGGLLDGKSMYSDSPDEVESQRVQWMCLAFALGKEYVERTEDMDRRNLGTFRLPSPKFAELAKKENWSEAQRNALMPYYNYRVTDMQQAGDMVLFRAEFVNTDW